MALYKYFQSTSMLPKPDGPLSVIIPSSTIAAANKEVKQVLNTGSSDEGNDTMPTSKRGKYEHFTPKEEVQIGKRAVEYGVTASVHYFS